MTQITKGTEQISFMPFLFFSTRFLSLSVPTCLWLSSPRVCLTSSCPRLRFPSFHYLPLSPSAAPHTHTHFPLRLTPSSSSHLSKPIEILSEWATELLQQSQIGRKQALRCYRQTHTFPHAPMHMHIDTYILCARALVLIC